VVRPEIARKSIAFLIFLPNLLWNIQIHFPFLELQANIRSPFCADRKTLYIGMANSAALRSCEGGFPA
jgi:hypothetical protein